MHVCFLCVVLVSLLFTVKAGEDRLKHFYRRIKKKDVIYCKDRTKLLPGCKECIPGLQRGPGSEVCNAYLPDTDALRVQIKKVIQKRFGKSHVANRPFGLYPYLETNDFLFRQVTYGNMLSAPDVTSCTVVDIGAYYNPINLFMTHDACFENIIVIEPILDALSVSIPCHSASGNRTHVMFLPVTFAHYMKISSMLPAADAVVCVGCDSHYGPSRQMLETAFARPYTLYFEFATEYTANLPYLEMGTGPGESTSYTHNFRPNTNDTGFTQRSMKVIHYT